ncbi:MAG TPA: universal stress protein [Solirubrobacteraceae bacterium]|jgi:nucleotide-binding universal stress UspA family protein
MVALLVVAGLVAGAAVGLFAPRVRANGHHHAPHPATTRQILLPFTGTTLSRRALEAAVRLARVEEATLMPAFLATVPLHLSLDTSLPNMCEAGMPLLEAIEQRAAKQEIPVESRVERGRSYRHALERLLAAEHFDRVIISATDEPRVGLSGPDLLWLLENADAEVLILRPAPEDTRVVSPGGLRGHF